MRAGFGRWRQILAGLLLVLSAPPLQAGTPQSFAGIQYELPEGWTQRETREGMLLERSFAEPARPRAAPGKALIQIARPVPAGGSDLAAAMARMVAAGLPELASERPLLRGGGITTNGHAILYEDRCCGRRNGVSLGADYVAIASGETFQLLQLVQLSLGSEQKRETARQFDALVRSLRLAPGDEPFQLRPPRGAGGLEGLYTYLNTGLRPNAFGGTDFYADNNVMLFDPSGLYSSEVPAGERNVAAHCREKPADCGFYRLTGDTIERLEVSNRYGLLTRDSQTFARRGEDLRIGETDYRRIAPLPAGTRLQGRWRYFFASSGSTATGSGSVAAERLLVLSSDGRFQRSGFSGASSSTETGGGTTGFTGGRQRPVTSGSYAIAGHRLTLTGDDGQVQVMSLFMPDKGSDKLLVIDGNNYLRQDAGQ